MEADSAGRDREDLSDANDVAIEPVGAAQRSQADPVTFCDLGQGLPASDDMPDGAALQRRRVLRHVTLRRRVGAEVVNDARVQRACQRFLVIGVAQRRLFARIRDRVYLESSRSDDSSRGFEIYAVSTNIEGMSGDVSTRNDPCCTSDLRMRVTCDICSITRSPATMLELIDALCDKSRRTRASTSSLSAIETPPIKSDAFSRSARRRVASSEARRVDNA